MGLQCCVMLHVMHEPDLAKLPYPDHMSFGLSVVRD